MRLIALLFVLSLAACGPQPPDAVQWQSFSAAAEGHGTAKAIAARCGFATEDLDQAFQQAQARYVLTAQQTAELAQISATAATAVAGDAVPPEHALCADGKSMSLSTQELLRRL